MPSIRLLSILSLLIVVASCGSLRPTESAPRTSRPTNTRSGDATSHIRTDVVTHAQELLNIPYKYGGNRPNEGFDCSGLVVYLYQNAGLERIPRTSRTQAAIGQKVSQRDARPGDLVFFKRGTGPVFHVSVVVEATASELWVIHATSSRGVIRENLLASNYWRPKIHQIRSVF